MRHTRALPPSATPAHKSCVAADQGSRGTPCAFDGLVCYRYLGLGRVPNRVPRQSARGGRPPTCGGKRGTHLTPEGHPPGWHEQLQYAEQRGALRSRLISRAPLPRALSPVAGALFRSSGRRPGWIASLPPSERRKIAPRESSYARLCGLRPIVRWQSDCSQRCAPVSRAPDVTLHFDLRV